MENIFGGLGLFAQLLVLAFFTAATGKLTDSLLMLRRQGFLKAGAALATIGGFATAGYMVGTAYGIPGSALPVALMSALVSASALNTATLIKRHIVNTRIGRANWEAELKRRYAAQEAAESATQKQD